MAPMRNLGTLGGTYSKANAINSHGVIVGESTTAHGELRAFLYYAGVMYDLNSLVLNPPGILVAANGINTRGEIVGRMKFKNSYPGSLERGFLLTPIR